MKVTYIHHNSFFVETASAYALFDYYKGNLPKLEAEKPLYVFASHRHWDHFSKIIFKLANEHKQVTFVLSDDISEEDVPLKYREQVIWIAPNASTCIGPVKIETVKSTDEGVAFLVTIDTKTIYHGGDLNDWVWVGEADEWNHKMTAVYRKILEKWREREIHVAFLNLDGRQQSEYYRGMDYFMRNMKVEAAFPMHFWEDYALIKRFKERPEGLLYRERVHEIAYEGEAFLL